MTEFVQHLQPILKLPVVPATITAAPMNETVTSPANASLTCEADGVPAPTITWLREVQGALEEVPTVVEDDNITLITITQTQMTRTTVSTIRFFLTQPPFAAAYTCRVSNLLGTNEQVSVLTIHGELVVVAFINREGNEFYMYTPTNTQKSQCYYACSVTACTYLS